MVSHWSLSDNKPSQVSRILLSILADLSNAVVWMLSALPLISKSSSPCTNYNWYNHHFHVPRVFNSLARSSYLSSFSLSFNLSLRLCHLIQVPLLLQCIYSVKEPNCVVGYGFFKQESMYAIMTWHFPNQHFFSVLLWAILVLLSPQW